MHNLFVLDFIDFPGPKRLLRKQWNVNAGVQIKATEISNNDNNTHSLNLLIMKGNERERKKEKGV